MPSGRRTASRRPSPNFSRETKVQDVARAETPEKWTTKTNQRRTDTTKKGERTRLRTWLSVGLWTMAAWAVGAEYFVNPQGNDGNNGLSRPEAFLTILKGVDVLKPGDTLTIGPGEYSENVMRDRLGGPDADTIIRAEMPGTVLLRGDVPVPAFRKVEGYQFVYATELDQTPEAILEHDTLRVLPRKPNVMEVEFAAGAFHHDGENGKEIVLLRAWRLAVPLLQEPDAIETGPFEPRVYDTRLPVARLEGEALFSFEHLPIPVIGDRQLA